MKQRNKTKLEKPAIKKFITETDLKREMENAIEQKDATIVTLSLELSEIKEKYKKQSQRLGGYVQSNKNYKEKNKLQVLEICDLGITINSLLEKSKGQLIDINGLKNDLKNLEYSHISLVKDWHTLKVELEIIQSKWWFKLFNW